MSNTTLVNKWTVGATVFTITNLSILAYHIYLRKASNATLQQQLHHMANETQSLKSTANLLDNMHIQKEELSQQLIEKMEKITNLDQIILSLQRKVEQLQQNMEKLQHENKVLRDSIRTPVTPSQVDVTSLEIEITKLKEEKIELLKQLEKAHTSHQIISQQANASKDLHDKLHGMSQDLDGLRLQLEQQLISNSSLHDLVNKIKEDKQNLEETLLHANEETISWKHKYDKLLAEMATLEEEKEKMHGLVRQFRVTVAQHQKEHLEKFHQLQTTTQDIFSIVNNKI